MTNTNNFFKESHYLNFDLTVNQTLINTTALAGNRLYYVINQNQTITSLEFDPDLNGFKDRFSSLKIFKRYYKDDKPFSVFTKNGRGLLVNLEDEYELSTPYDLTTAVKVNEFNVNGSGSNYIRQLVNYTGNSSTKEEVFGFEDSGYKLVYANSFGTGVIYTLDLQEPYNIATANSSNTESSTLFEGSTQIECYDISEDGKFLYVFNSNDNPDTLYQYALKETGNLYAGIELVNTISGDFEVNSATRSIKITPDGSKLFLGSYKRITEIDFGTNFDVSTLDLANAVTHTSAFSSFNIFISGILFNSDGTKVILSDYGNKVLYEYTFGTAYDFSTITLQNTLSLNNNLDNVSFFGDLGAIGLAEDGTSLYLQERQSNGYTVKANFNTAFDLSSYTGIDSNKIQARNFIEGDGFFEPERMIVYNGNIHINGDDETKIYKIQIENSDLSTASHTGEVVNTVLGPVNVEAYAFSHDGKNLIIFDKEFNLHHFKMRTPYDIANATSSFSINIKDESQINTEDFSTAFTHIRYNENGSEIIVNNSDNRNEDKVVIQTTIKLNINYDLDTYFEVQVAEYPVSFDGGTTNLNFSNDGRYAICYDFVSQELRSYELYNDFSLAPSLKTPEEFVKTSNTFDGIPIAFDSNAIRNVPGFNFADDGNILYITSGENRFIYRFDLSVPYDVSNIDYNDAIAIDILSQDRYSDIDLSQLLDDTSLNRYFNITSIYINGICFKSDGTKVYLTLQSSLYRKSAVFQYNLSTAWDLNAAVAEKVIHYDNINYFPDNPVHLEWKPDGTRFWIVDSSDNRSYEYDLTTAWEIDSASYTNNSYYEYRTKSIKWNEDGTKFFLVASSNIQEYTPSQPYSFTSVSSNYSNRIFGLNANDSIFINGGNSLLSLGKNELFVMQLDGAYSINQEQQKDSPSTVFVPLGKGIVEIDNIVVSSDGTKIFATEQNADDFIIQEYNMSTPFDLNTMSIGNSFFIDSVDARSGFDFSSDGKTLYGLSGGETLKRYSLQNSYDLSSIFNEETLNDFNDVFGTSNLSNLNESNEKLYIGLVQNDGNYFSEVDTSGREFISAADTVVTTNVKSQEFSEYWTNIDSISIEGQNINANNAFAMFSTDSQESFSAMLTFGGSRKTVRNNEGQWQVNIGGTVESNYVLSSANNINDPYTFESESQIAVPRAIEFGDAGSRIFIIGNEGYDNKIVSGSLSVSYDISTITYDEVYVNESSISGTQYDIQFNDTGTKMFIAASDEQIHSYTLPTAWTLANTTFDNVSYNLSSEVGDLRSFYIGDSGSKIFALDDDSDSIHVYNLSSPYDLSTMSYANTEFDVSTEASGAIHIDFDSTGTNLYVSDFSEDKVVQYQLSNAWDLSSGVSVANSAPVGDQEGYPGYIKVKPDGSEMYVLGNEYIIFKYEFGTSNDITTLSYTGSKFNLSPGGNYPEHMQLKDDGTVMYVSHEGKKYISVYNLATPDDISTASFVEDIDFNASISATEEISSFFIGDNGTKLYISETFDFYADPSTSFVKQYDLGTAWDLSTATLVGTKDFTDVEEITINRNQIQIKPDGTKLFVHGMYDEIVYEFDLTTPWDITTATYSSNSFNMFDALNGAGIQEYYNWRIHVNDEGTRWFMFGLRRDEIFQFSMATPWNISSSSYDGVLLNVDDITTYAVRAFTFNNDGSKLYIGEYQNGQMHEFNTRGLDPLSVIWTDATNNNKRSAIIEALDSADANKSTINDFTSSASSISTGEYLDLAFIFRPEAQANTELQTSNGPVINSITTQYDAQDIYVPLSIENGDYTYKVPSNNKVYFESLKNTTMKITVK